MRLYGWSWCCIQTIKSQAHIFISNNISEIDITFTLKYLFVYYRTSARLLETKATHPSSQYNTVTGRKPTAAKSPAVVLALDRVNGDGTIYSTGQLQSVPSGAQHAMSSTASAKPSFYGSSQGWDTVRRIFNPHRGEFETTVRSWICSCLCLCLETLSGA